jgi:hypothetical protein
MPGLPVGAAGPRTDDGPFVVSVERDEHLDLAARAGVVVVAYVDDPVGAMAEGVDGSRRFTAVTLCPAVTITDSAKRDKTCLVGDGGGYRIAGRFGHPAASQRGPGSQDGQCVVDGERGQLVGVVACLLDVAAGDLGFDADHAQAGGADPVIAHQP